MTERAFSGFLARPSMLGSEKELASCQKGFGVEKNLFIQRCGALMIFQKPELHSRLSGLKFNDHAEEGMKLVGGRGNALDLGVGWSPLGKGRKPHFRLKVLSQFLQPLEHLQP